MSDDLHNLPRKISSLRDELEAISPGITKSPLQREVEALRARAAELERQVAAMPMPDWSQAPEWAKWWCMDGYGTAYWYDLEPLEFGAAGWLCDGDANGKLDRQLARPDWRTLKVQRPSPPPP